MNNKIILVSSTALGKGDDRLGEAILENFFTIVKQEEVLPHAIFCMNSGVIAMTKDSFLSVHFEELEARGVEILGCKTCLDSYGLENQLVVGKVSTMMEFVKLSSKYEVLTIS